MKTCTWREDAEGNWQTDCGGCFILWDDAPSDNDMRFCCYCGKPLVEVEYTEPTMDQPSVAATLSLCCGIVRAGWKPPGVMHDGECRKKHGGQLGPTYYLSDSGLVMAEDGTLRRRP